MIKRPTTTGIVDEECAELYQMTPLQHSKETEKLWSFHLGVGGSLDPEPDTQSPFYVAFEQGPLPVDRRADLRILRRSRVWQNTSGSSVLS